MAEREEFQTWLTFADYDLRAAQTLRAQPEPLLEIVCFHCQQAAEKYLKAFILRHRHEVRKTHDLADLCRTCTEIVPGFDQIRGPCIDLSDYAVETRYPYPFSLEVSDMEKALADLQTIRAFVLQAIETTT